MPENLKILITGGTGLVGRAVLAKLGSEHNFILVSRSGQKSEDSASVCRLDLTQGEPNPDILREIDAVIHLAGESVVQGRWTSNKKKRIRDSRILGTRNLVSAFSKLNDSKLKVFISASAIGFYGDRGEEELHEGSTPGEGFLSEVCQEWESELFNSPLECRKVALRIGVVLAEKGGALAQMVPVFKMGLGGPLGNGKHWMSWIHVQDLVQMIQWALETEAASGVFNAVSPQPVQNKKFTVSLAKSLKRPAFFPVPRLAARLALGEVENVLFASQKVLPRRATELGFQFQYRDLDSALESLSLT